MIGMNKLGQKGRLGNQLFQYAALVGIAKNMGYDFCIPDHSKATWFDQQVDGNTVTVYHQLQHLFEMNYLDGRFGEIGGYEIDLHQAEFCEELFNECPDNSSLLGHFESYHYFENAEEELRKDFVVREHLIEAATKFHKDKGTQNPVCVSVRRGDYIKFQDHHPPCVESYYRECMEKLGKDRQYVITSDDIEWCKTIFVGDNFVFNDVTPEGVYKPHFDFAVGTLCDDFIIANSTFSWWIAWVGGNKDKQIFIPKPWFGPALSHIDTEGYYVSGMNIVERGDCKTMMDLTFLIPTRIETEDRLRNIISSVSYLLAHIPAKVIVKEVSGRNTFKFRALPEIKKRVSIENLTHLYEENNDPLFCKSKVLNDLIVASDTKVVANYDADCILPLSSYHQAYGAINDGHADIVYPYGCGIYQWRAEYSMDIFEDFMNKLDISVLDRSKTLSNSTIGWTQFINRQKYIDSYMMNENFVSWGCEDDEFYFRMSTLGNRIARIDNYVYHLEHGRTHNSWFSNPNFNNNWTLWNTIKTFDRNQLVQYYENQDYLKTRKAQLK